MRYFFVDCICFIEQFFTVYVRNYYRCARFLSGKWAESENRKNLKDIGGYYRFLKPKPIKSAEYLGEVYCGIIKTDIRELFLIRLTDGSAELVQVKSCSSEHMKLLRLCD